MAKDKNSVRLYGKVVSMPVKVEELRGGESLYCFRLSVLRSSGVADILPIRVSNWVTGFSDLDIGAHIGLEGEIRTHKKKKNGKNILITSVFCAKISYEDGKNTTLNDIVLCGTLSGVPRLRKAKNTDRDISELGLVVERYYGKTCFVPCIAWGRAAEFASSLNGGDRLEIRGRLQSREYIHHVGEGYGKGVTYEVSISELNRIGKKEGFL